MKIETLALKNFKGIEALELSINGNSTVFFGNNAVGKSTVLDAVQLVFIKLFGQIGIQLSSTHFSYEKIHDYRMFGKDELEVSIKISLNSLNYNFSMNTSNDYFSYGIAGDLVDTWNKLLQEENHQIPILAYYQSHRNIRDITMPPNNMEQSDYSKKTAYCHAFDSYIPFVDFFTWFRERSELENAQKAHTSLPYEDKQLSSVKSAILRMLADFSDLCMRFFPLRLVAIKHDYELQVDQLSDGEKSILCMFADIARRLAIANPIADNPLLGEGLVFIDEIDAHLHPAMQARIMPILIDTFPNIQFLITTHSPKILSEYVGSVIELINEDGKIHALEKPQLHLWDAGYIMQTEMNTNLYNESTLARLRKIYSLINSKKHTEAEQMISDFRAEIGNEEHPELFKAETILWGIKKNEKCS